MRKLYLISTCAAALLGTIPLAAKAAVVVEGTDYFQTIAVDPIGVKGTYDTIPGLGLVLFKGVAFGPGATDTIVRRTADITINAPTSVTPNLLLTGLQLESTNLATPIFVSLDPTKLASDTGTMTINGSVAGGTLTSSLDVFFDVCTALGVSGVGCGSGSLITTGSLDPSTSGPLVSQPSAWLPTPPPGAVLVTGLVGNPAANFHTNLAAGQVDLFPDLTEADRLAQHCIGPAGTTLPTYCPEPATLALLGTALIGLAGSRRRRR